MNNVQGFNTAAPQMAFKAKTGNRKAIHEFIDKSSDFARDYLRPLEEKTEIAKRESAALFAQSFIGNIAKRGEALIEHIRGLGKPKNETFERYRNLIEEEVEAGRIDADHAVTLLANKYFSTQNKYIKMIEKARERAYLEDIKNTEPEMYAELLRQKAEHKAAQMTNIEIIKYVIKNLFKKT